MLSSGWVYAAGGSTAANACAGQNADSDCVSAGDAFTANVSTQGRKGFWHIIKIIWGHHWWYPTPTPTVTTTATVTETPTETVTVTTTPTETVTVTTTPTETVTATPTSTSTVTPEPGQINLVMTGPATVGAGETFSVNVVAQHVPDPGLYGAQFEVHFDPALISVANLQLNSALTFAPPANGADNNTGVITFVASQQGNLPGLTGDVTLLTFEATADAAASGDTTFTFEGEKIGDPQAMAFTVSTESYTVSIEAGGTVTPTPETPTATPETPTATPETPTATPETPTATPETPTATPETPTATPETPTATPETPTATPETPTATPETPTATPETPTPTPETPTPEPTTALVSGQVGLQALANDNWAGSTVSVDDTAQSSLTDANGSFAIADVSTGEHSSITADATGFLPAVCSTPTVTAPETLLANVTLLNGDLNDDDTINIMDATMVGTNFGTTGPDLPADLNQDGVVDIFDIIIVSVNFGQGTQVWDCQP
jgi:hypothetical protein